MDILSNRKIFRKDLATAYHLRNTLGGTSYVAEALSDDLLREIHDRIEGSREEDLAFSSWPYIFSYAATYSAQSLAELDADIDLVAQNGSSGIRALCL